ncbi:N-acetyltransferase [Thermogymnomonas acidicola]|uniref:N-acetyltransferase n=1 Tax=Thermogymnomonas acidicola TaxID=399579 RepID=A0AA37BSI6_9ARCH|nr:GNAT family N-acetyltransferase [Thermogymnomonas acidicola]GGM78615.1 N-acetyltransferase [Thermogymnomonas acidicola]
MKAQIEIRRMEERDLGTAADLVLRLKRLNEEFDSVFEVAEDAREKIEEMLARFASDRENHLVMVAESGGKVVGIVFVTVVDRSFYSPKEEARIVDFYIMPEFRRKGIGKMLIERVTRELNEKGVRFVTAEFPSHNLIALNFYRGIGFREILSVYGKPIEED